MGRTDPTSGFSVVSQALVTPFARGGVRASAEPHRWMTGAVHDEHGVLCRRSQRIWSPANPSAPAAVDRRRVAVSANARTLPGRHIYAGHWTGHFGHFLVEVLPRLWPEPDRSSVEGIVAHRSFRGGWRSDSRRGATTSIMSPWQSDLLELAGYGSGLVTLVRDRPLRVAELVVATPPAIFRERADPPAVQLWQRVATNAGNADVVGPRRLFLSRARFVAGQVDQRRGSHGDRTSPEWDRWVEGAFSRAGFEVVHPETLPIREQVQLARSARVIAGPSGSALHLAALSEPGCRVIEIGDVRSPSAIQSSQQMINDACGHESDFVPLGSRHVTSAVIADLD